MPFEPVLQGPGETRVGFFFFDLAVNTTREIATHKRNETINKSTRLDQDTDQLKQSMALEPGDEHIPTEKMT